MRRVATVVIVGIVIAVLLSRPHRPSTLEWFAIAATVLAVIAQLGPAYYLFTHEVITIRALMTADIAGVVDAAIPSGGCALSDAPSKLVTTNRFVATTLPCNDMIDPEGAKLSYG